MFYIRLMRTFLVGEILGPKIIMLGKMMIDVLVFVRILLIFVISFGIMYTAILFPNTRPSFLLLKRIFYVPYWQIFGETFLDVLTGDQESCTKKESVADDDTRCPEEHILAPVFGAAYMFLTNIILINLLISMFSSTFKNIQKRSKKIWRFYLYSIVREYCERPVIPFPFIVLAHIFLIIRCCPQSRDNPFKAAIPHLYQLTTISKITDREISRSSNALVLQEDHSRIASAIASAIANDKRVVNKIARLANLRQSFTDTYR
ncbi:transient receptor potential cation channel subfamily M member 3-like [Dreissena polymorpha]|uniref:transient receptor potential cation channel subfamily M member 3-like n=1 Tax=Dreissena polymorpha TaxID=45954 RepID=UPI0022646DFB|nr:transient receptor potential cation channel subfamily M member 3-like [Dreissena polymorpha]